MDLNKLMAMARYVECSDMLAAATVTHIEHTNMVRAGQLANANEALSDVKVRLERYRRARAAWEDLA